MDIKTTCQILLGSLLAAVALSVLGLAADNISYVNNHHDSSPVGIHYTRWNETAQAQYSYWVTIDYLPSRFSTGTMNAMLAASIVCGVVGAGVAIGSWIMRGKKELQTSFSAKKEHKRFLPLLPTSIILTTITFLISFALAIYVWYPVMRWPITFKNSLPTPKIPAPANAKSVTYQSPFAFTPEVWNCFLYPYIVDPAQSRRVQGLCREAGVAKYLMIPLLVLSAALLLNLLWTWRQARIAAASNVDNLDAKDVEQVSVQGKD